MPKYAVTLVKDAVQVVVKDSERETATVDAHDPEEAARQYCVDNYCVEPEDGDVYVVEEVGRKFKVTIGGTKVEPFE